MSIQSSLSEDRKYLYVFEGYSSYETYIELLQKEKNIYETVEKLRFCVDHLRNLSPIIQNFKNLKVFIVSCTHMFSLENVPISIETLVIRVSNIERSFVRELERFVNLKRIVFSVYLFPLDIFEDSSKFQTNEQIYEYCPDLCKDEEEQDLHYPPFPNMKGLKISLDCDCEYRSTWELVDNWKEKIRKNRFFRKLDIVDISIQESEYTMDEIKWIDIQLK